MPHIVEKTRWFRLRATLQRCQEEKEILTEEIIRVYASFSKMQSIWVALVNNRNWDEGRVCYAHKQSAMYCPLAQATMKAIKASFGLVVERSVIWLQLLGLAYAIARRAVALVQSFSESDTGTCTSIDIQGLISSNHTSFRTFGWLNPSLSSRSYSQTRFTFLIGLIPVLCVHYILLTKIFRLVSSRINPCVMCTSFIIDENIKSGPSED